jgi:prolyl 4-hydroxylase
MRLRVVLLVLVATAVVPVLLLGEDDDAVVAPAPPFNPSRVKAVSWQPRYIYSDIEHLVGGGGARRGHTCMLTRFLFRGRRGFRICICRIFVYKGFLSDDECDHLVTLVSERAADRWALFALLQVTDGTTCGYGRRLMN